MPHSIPVLLLLLYDMEKMTSSGASAPLADRKDFIVRVIRITGVLFLVFGALVFFDLGGIADLVGLGDRPDMKHAFGGALMFTGLIDIVFIPRVIEQIKRR